MSTTATTRYTVGEKIVVCFYILEGGLRFINPTFVPWQDKLKNLDLRVLTVTEHHKVPNAHDPKGHATCDGFLLKDEKGVVWANQYPVASYGQMSDDASYYFNEFFSPDQNYDVLEDGRLRYFEDVTATIARINRGVKHLEKLEGRESWTAQLKTHFTWLIKKVEKETGAEVTFEPIWKDHPDITRAVITFKE